MGFNIFGSKKPMMSPSEFMEKELQAPVGLVVKDVPEEELAAAPLPYGAKCEHLTQIGSIWIDFNEVEWIDFDPLDGNCTEIHLCYRGGGRTIFLDDPTSDALESYLTENSMIQPGTAAAVEAEVTV